MQLLNMDKTQDLANRASFFGGAVSTREAAAAPGWKASVQELSMPLPGAVARPLVGSAAAHMPGHASCNQPPLPAQAGASPLAPTPKPADGRGRSPATMPQAAGGTRKQMADAALRGQILAMRELQRPPVGAGSGLGLSAKVPNGAGAPAGAWAVGGARPGPGPMIGISGSARRPAGAPLGGGERDRGASGAGADDAGFIEDDDGGGGGDGDWRAMLRAVTGGYDPSKFRDEGDDRRMVASRAEIEAEERRSARMARSEDERAAAEEAQQVAAKAAKKKKRRRGDGSFLLD
ncbi:hypothetical protein WJX81_002096 [Elliptochloris bilobata]|uniref:Uncharacterized protein n=1 Tax=Elliptochloris bilobata TaxID=381761 RepID=A0AAW1R035_9CHLO